LPIAVLWAAICVLNGLFLNLNSARPALISTSIVGKAAAIGHAGRWLFIHDLFRGLL